MKLIAEAHTNKEIAEILHLSEKTVESHRGAGAAEARHARPRRARALRDPARPGRALTVPLTAMSPRTRLVLVVIALLALAGTVLAAIAATSGDDNGGAAAVVQEVNAAGVEGPTSPFKGAVRPPGAARRLRAARPGRQARDASRTCAARSSCSARRTRPARRPARSWPSRSAARWTTCRTRARADPRLRAERRPGQRQSGFGARSSCSSGACAATSTTCSARAGSCSRCGASTGSRPRPTSRSTTRTSSCWTARAASASGFPANFLTPESLAHDLRLLVREAARS